MTSIWDLIWPLFWDLLHASTACIAFWAVWWRIPRLERALQAEREGRWHR